MIGGVPASKRCGERPIGDAVEMHFVDHLAAAAEGRQALGPFLLHIEHADAGRAVELVAGRDVEIAVEVLHVDRHMHARLAAVEQHGDAARVGEAHDVLRRRHGAEHVRHMGDRDQFRARRQQRFERA